MSFAAVVTIVSVLVVMAAAMTLFPVLCERAGQAAVDEGKANRDQREAKKLARQQPLMQKQRAEDHRGRRR